MFNRIFVNEIYSVLQFHLNNYMHNFLRDAKWPLTEQRRLEMIKHPLKKITFPTSRIFMTNSGTAHGFNRMQNIET